MKLDFTQIEGFNDMTEAEKLQAITNYDFQLVDKKQFDKKASELAELKRTSGTNAEQYTNEINTLTERLNALEKEKKVSEVKANYLALGYSNELATSTAQAIVDNDFATVFANQKTYQDGLETTLKEKMLANGNVVVPPSKPITMTKTDLNKLSVEERNKFYNENKDKFKEIMEGK